MNGSIFNGWTAPSNAIYITSDPFLPLSKNPQIIQGKKGSNFLPLLTEKLPNLFNLFQWRLQALLQNYPRFHLTIFSLTRVRNREEGQNFVESHLDILNQCKVWWKPGQDVYVDFPVPSDPQRPCTRIHPWFLDLGLRFLLLDLLKSILISYDMAICDLTLVALRLITCFELLNQWFRAELGL